MNTQAQNAGKRLFNYATVFKKAKERKTSTQSNSNKNLPKNEKDLKLRKSDKKEVLLHQKATQNLS